MSVYLGGFENWHDVIEEFSVDPGKLEPDDVFAAYEVEPYDGYALVIERKPNGLFDVVEGSHCSCFGLEGQYEPTFDMPLEAVRQMCSPNSKYDYNKSLNAAARAWLDGNELKVQLT